MKNLILLFCLFLAGNFSLSQEAHSIVFNPGTSDPTLQANFTDCKADELIVQFNTGNDDLRGRDDNCNVWINIRYGTSQEFLNVNNGARWIDNTSHIVELFLNNSTIWDVLLNYLKIILFLLIN